MLAFYGTWHQCLNFKWFAQRKFNSNRNPRNWYFYSKSSLDPPSMNPGLVYKFGLWQLIVTFSYIVASKLIEGGKPDQLQQRLATLGPWVGVWKSWTRNKSIAKLVITGKTVPTTWPPRLTTLYIHFKWFAEGVRSYWTEYKQDVHTLVDLDVRHLWQGQKKIMFKCQTIPSSRFELASLVAIGTDCIGSYKSNYHTITTAPNHLGGRSGLSNAI